MRDLGGRGEHGFHCMGRGFNRGRHVREATAKSWNGEIIICLIIQSLMMIVDIEAYFLINKGYI